MLLHVLCALAIPLIAQAADHQVVVGGPDGLIFAPEFVVANPGDTVSFTFKQKNHTVTQSTFASPCAALSGGHDSGFVPVADTQTDNFPVARLTVNDTNPLWFFCKQGNHCRQGMVFAVNPGDRFEPWKAAAIAGTSPAPPTQPSASVPAVVTVTATVTVGGQVYTTTYGSYPGSPAPTLPTSTDHKVIVGGPGKLIFDPANITAQAGDTVTFEFRQKNHTVTQSTFTNPCALSPGGFDSGFRPVGDAETANFPTYTIQINDTRPIWAYCAQGNHCKQGMVFAINAVESGPNNFEAFRSNAMGTGVGSPSGSVPAPSASQPSDNSAAKLNYGFWAGVVSMMVGVLFV